MPNWTQFVQGVTTILDSAGTALARRKTLQFGTGLTATDDGSKTVVTATGSGSAGSDDITNDSGVSGSTVSDALDQLDTDIAAAGVPQYLYGNTSHTPIVLFNGDTGTLDQSGNALNITNGTLDSHGIAETRTGQQVLYIGTGASMGVAASALLRITGDVTMIWMGSLEAEPSSAFNFMSCSGNTGSETEANNTLYSIRMFNGSDRPRVLGTFWEHSTGTNITLEAASSNGSVSPPALGQMMQVAMVRDGGDTTIYLNGEVVAGPTSQTAPTGGTVAQLLIGSAGPGSTSVASHYMFSCQVIGSALSTAQILAEYNRTMGPVHGTKS